MKKMLILCLLLQGCTVAPEGWKTFKWEGSGYQHPMSGYYYSSPGYNGETVYAYKNYDKRTLSGQNIEQKPWIIRVPIPSMKLPF